MCGLCGVVDSKSAPPMTVAQLVAMRDTLVHRGPDDAGHFIDTHVALGSRRLSILDLSPAGHMPMVSPDGRYTIVYNGEVYNYREFRGELEAKGYRFRSNSDTETLLYLYAEYGPKMLDRLIGMFAFAIWDAARAELFLVRDRLGIKPVVYSEKAGRLVFASEEKALIAAGVDPSLDEDCRDELLYFRYISGENTVFRNIKNLLPGHYLLWKDGTATIQRYWHLRERAEALKGTIENPVDWYQETFESAVKYRLISDVPVGVLLSGGLDSSSVATIASQFSPHIASFTVRFTDGFHDEGGLAREVADRNQLAYHELYVSPDNELSKLIEEASWYFDAPLIHGNDAHILAISRYAKSQVTVLLSGEGGDETLGGYVRYRPLQVPAAALTGARYIMPASMLLFQHSRLLGPRLRKLHRFMRQNNADDLILYNSCDVLPVDLIDLGMPTTEPTLSYRRQILAEAKQLYPSDRIRQVMYLDQHTFLQSLLSRNDRMTMGASIECRVPFLDHRLVEGCASLNTGAFLRLTQSKYLLRASIGRQLPQSILQHRKVGFGVPWDAYMREPKQYGDRMASLSKSEAADFMRLPSRLVQSVTDGFAAGDNRNTLLIRQLILINMWLSLSKRYQPLSAVST